MIEGWIVATCCGGMLANMPACDSRDAPLGGRSYNGVVRGVEKNAGDDSSDGESPSDAMNVARRRRCFGLLFQREWGMGALLSLARGAVEV